MKRLKSYIYLVLFISALLMVPKGIGLKMRHAAVRAIPSKWQGGGVDLEVENIQLKQTLETLRAWMALEQSCGQDLKEAKRLLEMGEDPFFERRGRYLAQLVDLKLRAVPAQVIFCCPSSFCSQIWLNAGSYANEQIGAEVVAINSPVVLGKQVVGIVEEVLETRCRVRLITDKALNLSVRCVRGNPQDAQLYGTCRDLAGGLRLRDDLEGSEPLSRALVAFAGQSPSPGSHYLAKGILHGGGESPFSKRGALIGEGFQYDFGDEEGPARDLRSGKGEAVGALPLICVGDLLVTTGLDSLFPPDLHVGIVSKIHPLREGGCAFGLEAEALAPQMHQLKRVTILPPL